MKKLETLLSWHNAVNLLYSKQACIQTCWQCIFYLGKDAGDAYVKAAELYKTTPDLQYESSKSFENAAKCLKRIDAQGIKNREMSLLR